MKVVILCGGKGLRYNNENPKGLAMIGDKPILQHVMNIYSIQGYNDFTLILGHKSELIIDYFNSINYKYNISYEHINGNMKTGGALRLAECHVKMSSKSEFLCTYCDSLGNINLANLISTHNKSNNIATLTAVKTNHIYGLLSLSLFRNKIKEFKEKPIMKEWINGGFFVFNADIFNYIEKDDDVLETDVFNRLVKDKKIGVYKHREFWETLNTPKDQVELNKICKDTMLEQWYNIK